MDIKMTRRTWRQWFRKREKQTDRERQSEATDLEREQGHLINYRGDSSDCGLESIRPGLMSSSGRSVDGRGGIEWSRCGFEPGWDPVPAPCVWYESPAICFSFRQHTSVLYVVTHWKQIKTIISLINKSSNHPVLLKVHPVRLILFDLSW